MSILAAALAGAVIYRLRGWGPPPPARWWKRRPILQTIFAATYGLTAYFAVGPLASFLVLVLTTGAVLTGHASYLGLGDHTSTPADGGGDEWYGGWIPWPGTFIHDFAGLAVSGLLITAPCGLALIAGGYVPTGAAVLASGALKAPAYALGRFVPIVDKLKVSEPLCGAFLWGSLAAIVW